MNTNNINLKVPFAEKDQAKSLGARWNAELKIWFVPQGVDAAPFAKWFTDSAPATVKATAPSTAKSTTKPEAKAKASAKSGTNDDVDIDAINAKLREASDSHEADPF